MRKHIAFTLIGILLFTACFGAPLKTSAQVDVSTIFFTTDSAFSVALPDGWAADGNRNDGLTVANSAAALQAKQTQDSADPQPGELFIQMLPIPVESMAGASRSDFLSAVAQNMASTSKNPPTLSDVQDLDFAGRPAVVITGKSSKVGAHLLLFPLAPQLEGLVVVAAPPDELDGVTDTALSVAATIRYSLSLDETQDDPNVTLAYPTGWVLDTIEGTPPIYALASSQEAYDAQDLSTGQYKIILANLGANFGLDTANLSVPDATTAWAQMLLKEGETISDPLTITLENGVEIVALDVMDKDGKYIGGAFVVQFTALDNVVEGVAFAAAPDEAYQISLTALNVLLTVKVAAPAS